MAEGGSRDSLSNHSSKRTAVTKRSTSNTWSHISEANDPDVLSQAIRRRDLKEYLIPLSVLHLDQADRKVIRIADVRDRIQTKTFTKWINKHLRKRYQEICDLFEDFRDGVKLLTLLEVLTSQILPRERGRLRFHRLQNVKSALDFLSHQNVKLVNIHPEDVADGNPKITLGLVWIIILKFQVTDVVLPGQHEHSVRQSLLTWSQQTVAGYPIKITDFSKCWRDGKAFLYLIHRNRPDLVNMRQVASNSPQENLELAFATAEQQLGVTRLLDPEDMQVDQPDEKSVITYVASLYNVFPLPSPSKPVQDNDLASKTSEYEALAKPLLSWLKEQTSKCANRDFPATLVEVKSDLNDYQRFRLEDIPAKLANKRRLEILFHELENMIGQFPLDEQIHIDNLTQHWDRFMSVADDREQALHAEVARLQRLQRLAEKVHKDTKLFEGYLDDVEQKLNEELSTYGSVHPLEAKNNCDALQQILSKIDSHIQNQLTDVQNLKDGRYHQADSMYKRVLSVHQRLEGLMNKLQTELMPKVRSVGPGELRLSTSASGSALASPSYRLSSSSSSSNPVSAAGTASPIVRQQQGSFSASPSMHGHMNDSTASPLAISSPQSMTSPHGPNMTAPHGFAPQHPQHGVLSHSQPASSTPRRGDTLDGNVLSNGGLINNNNGISSGMTHSQSGITPTSGAELLKECIEWVENRRKLLDPTTLEFTSIGKLEKTVHRLRAEHTEVMHFKSRLEECHQARTRMPKDEVQAFTQWLTRVESAYSSILSISSQQLSQCESLLEFAQDSTDELRWLNEKEEEELTRNWNATTMSAEVMREHFKRLMEELQSHEKQFNDVQDRGEGIVRQKAIGATMCQSYLTAMQEKWGWLIQVLSCIDVHLNNAQSFNQFHEEITECSTWLTEQTAALNSEFNKTNISLEEGEVLIKRMQEMRNTLAHYEQVIKSLEERQSSIVPQNMRTQVLKHPVPVEALCSYTQDDFSMEKGEDCILLDNTDSQRWRVRNSRAAAGVVPSICLTFPPPDTESKRKVTDLDEQFQAFIKLWKEKQSKLKLDMVFATMAVIKQWDSSKFKSLGAAQRDAIMKAVNNDAQKILSEPNGLSDNKQSKLREALQKCSDHYNKLNRKLREKESKEPRSDADKAEETIANVTYTLSSVESDMSLKLSEPIPRDLDTLNNISTQHQEVNATLRLASDDLDSLRMITPSLGRTYQNSNAPLSSKHQNVAGQSAAYQDRLRCSKVVLESLSECSGRVNHIERILNPLDTVTTDVDKLAYTADQLDAVKAELANSQQSMLHLGESCRQLRQATERSRPDATSHPDMDKLERDVTDIINKWQHLSDDADTKQKSVEKSLEILTLSGHKQKQTNGRRSSHNGGQNELSPREMFATLQERGSTLNRIAKSGQSSRGVKVGYCRLVDFQTWKPAHGEEDASSWQYRSKNIGHTHQ